MNAWSFKDREDYSSWGRNPALKGAGISVGESEPVIKNYSVCLESPSPPAAEGHIVDHVRSGSLSKPARSACFPALGAICVYHSRAVTQGRRYQPSQMGFQQPKNPKTVGKNLCATWWGCGEGGANCREVDWVSSTLISKIARDSAYLNL